MTTDPQTLSDPGTAYFLEVVAVTRRPGSEAGPGRWIEETLEHLGAAIVSFVIDLDVKPPEGAPWSGKPSPDGAHSGVTAGFVVRCLDAGRSRAEAIRLRKLTSAVWPELALAPPRPWRPATMTDPQRRNKIELFDYGETWYPAKRQRDETVRLWDIFGIYRGRLRVAVEMLGADERLGVPAVRCRLSSQGHQSGPRSVGEVVWSPDRSFWLEARQRPPGEVRGPELVLPTPMILQFLEVLLRVEGAWEIGPFIGADRLTSPVPVGEQNARRCPLPMTRARHRGPDRRGAPGHPYSPARERCRREERP